MAVQRIATRYNIRGQLESSTGYNATGGSVVNDMLLNYNDFGQLTTDYEKHKGANGGSTLSVGHAYGSISNGAAAEYRFTGGVCGNAIDEQR